MPHKIYVQYLVSDDPPCVKNRDFTMWDIWSQLIAEIAATHGYFRKISRCIPATVIEILLQICQKVSKPPVSKLCAIVENIIASLHLGNVQP